MKNLSIKAKILVIVLTTIVVVASIIATEAILSIKELSNENINSYKQKAYKDKQETLNNYVTMAEKVVETYYLRTDKEHIKKELTSYIDEQSNFLFSIINNQYEKYKDKMSDKELKSLIINTVESTKYGKSGYFWINDFNYKMVMHPIKKELTGKFLKNTPTASFVEIGVNALKGEKQSAHIQYSFYSPSSKKTVEKVSTVRVFKPYNWIIGTGAYMDDLKLKMQEEAKLAVSGMRYGNNGYFWINNSRHELVMHPIETSNIGKNKKDLQDPNGVYVYQEIVKVANNNDNGGIVKYSWRKPSTNKVEPKMAYVKNFKQWDWIIGTGIYVSDIEEKISTMEKTAKTKIESIIITIAIYALITAILCFVVISFISTKYIVKPIQNFQDGLLGFFKYVNREVSEVKSLDELSKDEIGLMAKVVNENIVKSKKSIEDDKKVIDTTIEVLGEFEQGDLCQRVKVNTSNPALQELTKLLNKMGDNMESNIDSVLDVLEQYSSYNYMNKVETHNIKEHLLKLANGVNSLGDSITGMLIENKKNGVTLQNSSYTLLENVDSLNVSSNEAAASLEQTAASLEEMTGNISSNTNNIVQMASYANEVTSSVLKGQELANETTKAMDEINDEVTSINEAITVIDQIAFQTNILSLNAAVEAATAGEAGKGFAVVAQEVRNLASRSAEAAGEIKKLVENATNKANSGKEISDEMKSGYNHLNKTISRTIELISDVESASKEQLSGIEQINDAVALLDQKTQQNANVASVTKDIAIDTQTIANKVVDNANKKEFLGK
jgi:methyl-accepting chemotaxis protein